MRKIKPPGGDEVSSPQDPLFPREVRPFYTAAETLRSELNRLGAHDVEVSRVLSGRRAHAEIFEAVRYGAVGIPGRFLFFGVWVELGMSEDVGPDQITLCIDL